MHEAVALALDGACGRASSPPKALGRASSLRKAGCGIDFEGSGAAISENTSSATIVDFEAMG